MNSANRRKTYAVRTWNPRTHHRAALSSSRAAETGSSRGRFLLAGPALDLVEDRAPSCSPAAASKLSWIFVRHRARGGVGQTGRRRSDDGRTDGPLGGLREFCGVRESSELRGPYAHSLSSTPAGMDPAYLNRISNPATNRQPTPIRWLLLLLVPADLAPHPVPPHSSRFVQIPTTRASTGGHRSTRSRIHRSR